MPAAQGPRERLFHMLNVSLCLLPTCSLSPSLGQVRDCLSHGRLVSPHILSAGCARGRVGAVLGGAQRGALVLPAGRGEPQPTSLACGVRGAPARPTLHRRAASRSRSGGRGPGLWVWGPRQWERARELLLHEVGPERGQHSRVRVESRPVKAAYRAPVVARGPELHRNKNHFGCRSPHPWPQELPAVAETEWTDRGGRAVAGVAGCLSVA